MKYLLDSNSFMTAARSYYSFVFGTKFWDFLVQQAQNNNIGSIDKVFDEMKKGNDELKNWSKHSFCSYFHSTKNNEVFENYKKLVNWAELQSNHYRRSAIDEFMKEDNADPWIIAYALSITPQPIVVTFEKLNKDAKNKISIANVCNQFNVLYCNLFDMMKELAFQF